MSEAASQLQSVQRAGLTCAKCGSQRLHRSHMRGLRERVLKLVGEVRAWRCEQCGARQLSDLRPRRKRSLPELPADFRPNPTPDPRPGPGPAPDEPVPVPDPKPRRARRKDPLAEKLKARKRKRLLMTAALVVLAGLGGAMIVMRTAGPESIHVADVE